MTVEVANFISELVITNPPDDDLTNEIDDHLRLIKTCLKNNFNGSGGDLFDKALVSSRSVIDSWTARLDVLEAAGTPNLISPVFGSEDIAFEDGNNVVITGLGFKPQAVIAWSQMHPIGADFYDRSQMCVATWFADNHLATSLNAIRGQPPSLTLFSSLLLAAISIDNFSEYFTDQLSIESVNDDGFEVKKDFMEHEVYLMYIELP